MASEVEICNRALQKLGAKRITSLTQDSPNARACNLAYEVVRDRALESHPWNFAIARAELAAAGSAPAWGRANSFLLPADFLCLRPDYPEDQTLAKDWIIEAGSIYSDDSDPIYIRYTYRVTDPVQMPTLFREYLSTLLALELCEELTQSNTKKESLKTDVKMALADARRSNAFQNVSAIPPEDPWITCRGSASRNWLRG